MLEGESMGLKPAMKAILSTNIYAITAQEFSLGRTNIEVVKEMLSAGIKVIQYREKEMSLGAMYEEGLKIRQLTKEAGACFIVNDHVDLAIALNADGVHIGQKDLPPLVVRALIGDEMILGLSTQNEAQAKEAEALGVVDYIGVGPLYETQTKKDASSPVGFAYLRYVAQEIALPFVVIGGIKREHIKEIKSHGGRMMALVSEIVGAPDIAKRIEEIENIIKRLDGK